MPGGGQLLIATGHESVTVTAGGATPGDYVRVTVSDSGKGMTNDVLARALEPFFTTKGPASSGLGLSQVYGLARQSGGTVRIASAPGAGTAVTLLLRRSTVMAATPDLQPDRTTAGALFAQLHVMVVDDDPAVRRVTVDMLHDLGCYIVEASCAEAALALLDAAAEEVDLLLVDYMMPGLNGIELAREVRKRGIDAPIVLATGYAEPGGSGDGHAGLLNARLSKPFTITELQTVLLRLHGHPRQSARTPPVHGQLHG
jgi:CheY-like chemotaxis protein